MRAWLKPPLGVGTVLPIILGLFGCSKSPPPVATSQVPESVLSANAVTSSPVPRRTQPLLITNRPAASPAEVATNTPPVVTCGAPQILPCSSAEGLTAALTAHVQDAEGDPLSVVWMVDGRERETQHVTAHDPPLSADLNASYVFEPGEHVVKVTVSDGKLTASCETTVTIQKDTQLPVIVCPRDVSVRADPGRCSAIVTFNPKATDNCPEVGVVCEPPSGSAFPIGSTIVTCTATDGADNIAQCGFEVAVQVTNRCPRHERFWEQSLGAWPIQSMSIGNQVYSRSQLIPLVRATVTADASMVLARQLIVATLNTADGSDPTPICRELDQANAAMGAFASKLPYRVSPASADGRAMLALANVLSAYNNRLLAVDCQP